MYVHDLALAFRVVTGHRAPPFEIGIIPNGCSMSTSTGEASASRRPPQLGSHDADGRAPAGRGRARGRCDHRPSASEMRSRVAREGQGGSPGIGTGAFAAADRHSPAARVGRVPAAREPCPDVRPPVLRADPGRSDARRAQGAARRRARLPRSLGRDLVPDDIPVIGGLDDLVVVVLAVDLFLDGVPEDVLDEKLVRARHRPRRVRRKTSRRIRRFTPGPLRRIMRRAPELVSFAGDTLEHSRVGPRVRSWINPKEESLA